MPVGDMVPTFPPATVEELMILAFELYVILLLIVFARSISPESPETPSDDGTAPKDDTGGE